MELLKLKESVTDKDCLISLTSCNSNNLATMENQLFAIAACQAENKKTILQDKSSSCVNNIQTQILSKTSEADSTSKEKDCKPFYNDFCKGISLHLLSHTGIDSAASVLNSSNSFLNKMVEKSWFSTNQMFHHNKNSQKICSQFFMSSLAECTDLDVTQTKSRKIRIYPTQQQKILFKQWFGISRKFYNEAVNWYNNNNNVLSWINLNNIISKELTQDYVKIVPYQIKKIAVRDCYRALKNGIKKFKNTNEKFELKYRTKKNPKQSCYIPKQALSINGIYHTIANKLNISEYWLLNNECQDLRLVKEYNRWYIVIPMKLNNTKLSCSENQRNNDIVALDPGVRTFITYFSENGYFGKIGNEFNRILSLQHKIDKLISKHDLEKNVHKKRNIYRNIGRIRGKIKFMVDELHWKTINFLVRNFKIIIMPTFEVSNMVKRSDNNKKRKINKTVVRAMLSYRFYEFGERLSNKCKEYGVTLIRSNEAYTSKTNSFNGEIMNIGSKKYFKHDGIKVDRDINGARNVMLRAMRDSSLYS